MSKISYSAWQKFNLCPRMYDIYYREKLEPIQTTSSLVFGSAMDEAINKMYLDNADPVKVFQENFKYNQMENVVFDKKDLDKGVFQQDQLESLTGAEDHYICWASLRVKGRVLLEYHQEVLRPKITRVYGVQKELTRRPGYIDLLASVEMEGEGKIVIDYKTSYYEYTPESPSKGAQLILYSNEEGINKTAYAVFLKNLPRFKAKKCKKCGNKVRGGAHKTCDKKIDGKRCHGEWEFSVNYLPQIQFLVGEPSNDDRISMQESMLKTEMTINWYNSVFSDFPKNLSTCDWVFGKRCPYYEHCRLGDSSKLKAKDRK